MAIDFTFPVVVGGPGGGGGGFTVGKLPSDIVVVTTTTTTTEAPTTTTTTTTAEPTTSTTSTTTPTPQNGLFLLGQNSRGILGNSSLNPTVTDTTKLPFEWVRSDFNTDGFFDKLSNGFLSSIARGNNIVLKKDGTVWTCGWNTYANLGNNSVIHRSSYVQVGVDTNWSSITSFGGIKKDGTLWMWGYGTADGYYKSRSNPVQIPGSWIMVSGTGVDFSWAAIQPDGSLYTWGANNYGQLGVGDIIDRSSPVQLQGNWDYVSTSGYSTLGIKHDGTLWSWGNNTRGQLGHLNTIHRSSPVQVGSNNNWTKTFATGTQHNFAMNSSGQLFYAGQTTTVSANNKSSFTQIGNGRTWLKVCNGGGSGAYLLENTGQVWYTNNAGIVDAGYPVGTNGLNECGFNYGFQDIQSSSDGRYIFGIRNDVTGPTSTTLPPATTTSTTSTTTPAPSNGIWFLGAQADGSGGDSNVTATDKVAFPLRWEKSDSAKTTISDIPDKIYQTMMFIDQSTSNLWSCGFNGVGNLGNTSTVNRSSYVQVGSGIDWQYVFATGGLKSDNTLWLWGSNIYGQLGQNNTTSRSSPVQVAGDWQFIESAQAGTTSVLNFGLKTDLTLWAWGHNYRGRLGLNDLNNRSSPTQIGTGTYYWVSAAATANGHTCAVKTDGTLWAWGYNSQGQLGQYDKVHRSSPVKLGTATNWFKCFATTGVTWALNDNGELWATGQFNDPIVPGSGYIKSSLVQVLPEKNWWQVCGAGTGFAAFFLENTGQVWYSTGTGLQTNQSFPAPGGDYVLGPLGYNMGLAKIATNSVGDTVYGYRTI
jgi:alpha-tubulin suppressor-like RCC1 family protein